VLLGFDAGAEGLALFGPSNHGVLAHRLINFRPKSPI
jgi:hypothetical protein